MPSPKNEKKNISNFFPKIRFLVKLIKSCQKSNFDFGKLFYGGVEIIGEIFIKGVHFEKSSFENNYVHMNDRS